MTYTPTEWETGDTITAALLNKMENGIAAGGGGGFDVVMIFDFSEYELSVVSGTYSDARAKILDGSLLAVITELVPITGEGTTTYACYGIEFTARENDIYIIFQATDSGRQTYQSNWIWYSDGTLQNDE